MTEPEITETPLEELTGLLRNQRARWRRWFGAVLVLVLAIGINQVRIQHVANEAKAAAATAQAAAATAQDAIDQLLAQRIEARVNTCFKDKKFADAHNALVLYFAALGEKDPSTDPELLADFKAKNLVPVPDCSPAGIAAFYAGQGGTVPPDTGPEVPVPATTTTTARKARATTTSTTARSTSTSRTTTTTTRPRPTTTTTACAGPSIPIQGVPCL